VIAEERGERKQAVRDLQRETERADELIEALQKQVAALTARLDVIEQTANRAAPPQLRAVAD
jgi:prefoldin subunit 5